MGTSYLMVGVSGTGQVWGTSGLVVKPREASPGGSRRDDYRKDHNDGGGQARQDHKTDACHDDAHRESNDGDTCSG